MSFPETVILGAIAGLTIFLGLPLARVRAVSPRYHAFLNALAIGVLLFLVWDILSKAQEPTNEALKAAMKSGHWTAFGSLVLMFVLGLVLGLIGLVTFADAARGALQVHGLTPEQVGDAAAGAGITLHELSPQQASLEEAFMDLTRDDLEFAAELEEVVA